MMMNMILTRHLREKEVRWGINGSMLPADTSLGSLLAMDQAAMTSYLGQSWPAQYPGGQIVAPIDDHQEVWASGVTYLRSRVERESESTVADVYAKVYEAERPELFFKALGWRCVGEGQNIRIRRDSDWNVPEPELTLVVNAQGEIVGYTAGNDVSSRAIEGENPLYLPQAKSYNGSCALGPGIVIVSAAEMEQIKISLEIIRDGATIFTGDTDITKMKRKLKELVGFLCREMSFPHGALLMTGTGIVPSHPFTLEVGDIVQITIGELTLRNPVAS
jgi:2-dehydro-3-deoxy-D-arabinonate dehydratase